MDFGRIFWEQLGIPSVFLGSLRISRDTLLVFRRFLLNLVRIFGNNSQFLRFFGSFGILRDPLVDCERILKNSWDLLVDFGKILWKLLETPSNFRILMGPSGFFGIL